MSNEYKKLSQEELLKTNGGVVELSSLGGGPVLKVKNPAAGSVSLKSSPSSDSVDIAQLKSGDVVQASGGKITANDNADGTPTTYIQVYVPSLKQSGWVNSDFLG